MESISPFLEKCYNYYPVIEKHGQVIAISQTGENVLGDHLISLSASLVLMVVHGDLDGRVRGIKPAAGQLLPEQKSC